MRAGRAANLWRRVASSVGRGLVTVTVACTAIFALLVSLPGDAASIIAGADQAVAEQLRQQHGLADPLGVRLLAWWQGVVTGDLGSSYTTGREVVDTVVPALVRTLWVAIPAWCIAVLLGWFVAAVIAWWHGTAGDNAANVVVGVGVGLPEAVWVASLTFVVAVWWGVLPAVSLLPPGTAPLQVPHLLILPGLCLAMPATAWMVRLLRGVAEDTAQSATVRSAQQRRTPFWFALWHTMMRPMVGAVAQVAAALAVVLLGGSVIVESMLSYDGIGRVLAGALRHRDVPVVMGATLLMTILGATALIVADLIATSKNTPESANR